MIVVADTGPLNYLILLGHIEVLHILYGEVVIPPAVQDELLDPSAPEPVRSWISSPPPWLEIRTPGRIDPRLSRALDEANSKPLPSPNKAPGRFCSQSTSAADAAKRKRLASRSLGHSASSKKLTGGAF